MALATQCPHCHTTFRVAADQLKLRGGAVRCGACNEVFDGGAHLIDLNAPPRPDAAIEPAPEPGPEPGPEPEAQPEVLPPPPPSAIEAFGAGLAALEAFDAEIAASQARAPQPGAEQQGPDNLDADADANADADSFDPFGILPEPAADAAPAQVPETEPDPDPEPPTSADTARAEIERGGLPLLRQATAMETVLDPNAIPTLTVAPRARSRSAGKAKLAGARPKWAADRPTLDEVKPKADPDEPEFVKRGREQERSGQQRRLAMLAGAIVLTLALLVQAVTTFRNSLAARFPAMAPTLASLCGALGCSVELPRQIDALSIETGELQTIGPDTFSLVTLLRNQGALSQAWPHIELELTDAADQALVRRVFAPADYLPAGQQGASGFGARSEQAVKLYFHLKDVKASGYHIAVFYP